MKSRSIFSAALLVTTLLSLNVLADDPKPFPGQKSDYRGFERYDFVVDGQKCLVVLPKTPAEGRPWIWRAEFFDHRPEIDLALVNKGFHLVYMNVGKIGRAHV